VAINRPPENLTVRRDPSGDNEDISALIEGLKFGTTTPGGDSVCTFSRLHAGELTDGDLWSLGTKILIQGPSGSWRWLGRIEEGGGDYWSGGCHLQYTVRGMANALDDQIYIAKTIFVSGMNIAEIMNGAIEAHVPIADIIPNADTDMEGRVLREVSQDFVLASPRIIINTLAPLGDGTAPIIWEVYSGGSDVAVFQTRARPTSISPFTGGYYVRMGDGLVSGHTCTGGAEVHLTTDLQLTKNGVAVKYRDERTVAGYAVLYRQAGSALLGGLQRDTSIDLNRLGILNARVIGDAADMMLAQISNPQNSGRQIVLHYPETVLDANLSPINMWEMRAGYIVKVQDLFSGDSNIGNEFFIQSTMWDEDQRTMTLQCGPVHV